MILVDTSVWIEHLRRGEPRLVALLEEAAVLTHPSVIGELALGHLRNRQEILDLLYNLPAAEIADDREVFALIERRRLQGSGIGWIDVHLLASTLMTHSCLWTLDRRLAKAAAHLGIGYAP